MMPRMPWRQYLSDRVIPYQDKSFLREGCSLHERALSGSVKPIKKYWGMGCVTPRDHRSGQPSLAGSGYTRRPVTTLPDSRGSSVLVPGGELHSRFSIYLGLGRPCVKESM